MAVAESSQGHWSEAEEALLMAEKYGIIDSPASAVVALQRAMKAFVDGNNEETERQLERVDRFKEGLDQNDKVRYDYLSAVTSIRQKKYPQAKLALEAVSNEFKTLGSNEREMIVEGGKLDVSFELAYVYYETGNMEGALSQLKGHNSSEAKTLEAAIRRKLGYQALKNKKYDTALENFNRLNSLGNATPSDQYNLVLAKMQAKNIADSASLERYARQNIPEAVLNYAIYLDETGDAARATQYYQQYVSMTSARKSEDVRRMLLTKQRVWGGEQGE